MADVVIMPKQGNTVESCVILEWRKDEGDTIAVGDILCEAETDKTTIEVESTAAGTLLKILRPVDDDVPVMDPIAVVGEAGEDISAIAGSAGAATEAPAEATAPTAAPGVPATPAAPATPTAPTATSPVPETTTVDIASLAGPAAAGPGSGAASPRARNRAAAEGIALSGIGGTGPKGRIIERDIEAVLASGAGKPARAPAAPPAIAPRMPATTGEPIEEIAVKGVRKITAERMKASQDATAAFTLTAAADATEILGFRKKLKTSGDEALEAVTINDLILFAASRVLPAYPEMNAYWLGDRILRFRQVHLGCAMDTPRGLMVPVIFDAQNMRLSELSAEVRRLRDDAEAGKLDPAYMTGSTFTVSNLGSLGVEAFTPVLNPPEAAILGVGTTVPRPVTNADGEVEFRPFLVLSLTVDHQAVDGAPAARFLAALKRAIEQFDLTLAW